VLGYDEDAHLCDPAAHIVRRLVCEPSRDRRGIAPMVSMTQLHDRPPHRDAGFLGIVEARLANLH